MRIAPPPAKGRDEPLPRRRDALVTHHGAVRVDDPNLTVSHVEIDGTIDHGWLLLLSALFPQGVNSTSVERKLPR
jgi:hypothetical protein